MLYVLDLHHPLLPAKCEQCVIVLGELKKEVHGVRQYQKRHGDSHRAQYPARPLGHIHDG